MKINTPSRLSLATPLLSQHAVLIDLRGCPPGEWTDFARFYAATRRQEGTGLALLVLATTPAPEGLRSLSWQGRGSVGPMPGFGPTVMR